MGDGPRGPDQRGILEILGAGSLSISPAGTFLRQAGTHSLLVRGLMEQDRPGQTRVPEPQVLRRAGVPVSLGHPYPSVRIVEDRTQVCASGPQGPVLLAAARAIPCGIVRGQAGPVAQHRR